jgi:hypothetical protein
MIAALYARLNTKAVDRALHTQADLLCSDGADPRCAPGADTRPEKGIAGGAMIAPPVGGTCVAGESGRV